jgi:hypothetical protein
MKPGMGLDFHANPSRSILDYFAKLALSVCTWCPVFIS